MTADTSPESPRRDGRGDPGNDIPRPTIEQEQRAEQERCGGRFSIPAIPATEARCILPLNHPGPCNWGDPAESEPSVERERELRNRINHLEGIIKKNNSQEF